MPRRGAGPHFSRAVSAISWHWRDPTSAGRFLLAD
jgi:hypothetical protein